MRPTWEKHAEFLKFMKWFKTHYRSLCGCRSFRVEVRRSRYDLRFGPRLYIIDIGVKDIVSKDDLERLGNFLIEVVDNDFRYHSMLYDVMIFTRSVISHRRILTEVYSLHREKNHLNHPPPPSMILCHALDALERNGV